MSFDELYRETSTLDGFLLWEKLYSLFITGEGHEIDKLSNHHYSCPKTVN